MKTIKMKWVDTDHKFEINKWVQKENFFFKKSIFFDGSFELQMAFGKFIL
jgi:hypothetical protein